MTAPPRYCQACGRRVLKEACKCKSGNVAATPPHASRGWCRVCHAFTRWQQIAYENGRIPVVLRWRCGCGSTRTQYADCASVETMIRSVLEENVRRAGANIDLADAYSQLDLQCWKPYLDWNPDGLTFESYAFGILRRRAFDHYRQLLGRRGEKPLANAFPLVYSDDGELTDLPPSEDALRSLDLAEALAVR